MSDLETVRPARVFLSYASSDRDSARSIAEALKQSGVQTWYFDEWEMALGDSLVRRIEEAAKSSDYLLILLSPAAVASSWVQHELNFAFSRELKDRAIGVVPVLLADCEVPLVLRDRAFLYLRQDRKAGIEQLVAQLSAVPAIQFKKLNPLSFERLVEDLLREMGFTVESSARTARETETCRHPASKLRSASGR